MSLVTNPIEFNIYATIVEKFVTDDELYPYFCIIELMRFLKNDDSELMKHFVKNSLLLLNSLYFGKDEEFPKDYVPPKILKELFAPIFHSL